MRHAEFWGGAVFAAFGAFAMLAGHDLGLGRASEPGPGAVVFWAGLLMLVLSGATMAAPAARNGPRLSQLWADARWGKVLVAVGALAAYAAMLGVVGFIGSTVALLIVLLRAIDPVRWPVAIAVALAAPAIVWLVMERGLAVRLPSGVLLGG